MKVLYLIENVPYELDSRVRRQSDAAKKMGASCIVICPAGKTFRFHQKIHDVHVYSYKKPGFGEGFASHILEYISSILSHMLLTFYVFVKHGFDVIHVANPPDILWMIAAPYRLLGKKWIYDQHDLVPELYSVRYAKKHRWMHGLVLAFERLSYRLANHVIVTNETFKTIAVKRGGLSVSDITVVRNGPWLSKDFPEVEPDVETRAMGDIVVGYLGIMNPQDHLDNFLRMASIIRSDYNRSDIGFVMIGSGDSFDSLVEMRDELGLRDAVRMTGSIPWMDVLRNLSATDICIQPDPPTEFNRHLTMNKLMEYMAMGKAVVAFDMPETRFSGGDTVEYLEGGSPEVLAKAVVDLADDSSRRIEMGQKGRQRIETVLAWEYQEQYLMNVYASLDSRNQLKSRGA